MFFACLAVLVVLGLKLLLPRLTIAGATQMALLPLMLSVSAPWFYFLLRDLGFPVWTLVLCQIGLAIAWLPVGLGFALKLAEDALLTHGAWRRATRPLVAFARSTAPKVSIHVPCYAEPPELVMASLDRLARLDYSNFEVIVCDNNTEDDVLWRPLAEHCDQINARLGVEKFRFFHVSPLAGAKAGALNFCLERIAPDVELVAVVDADYFAEQDFLSRLVGFFDDPKIGYVQTPHDYRSFEDNRYLRWCYYEYMPHYKVLLPGLQEYNAAYTVGTMCLLRVRALIEAGPWGEWCLTEDSEISIRIRACGYEGIHLHETFGRGLIPETFDDFKKQRYRWTGGPVQQVRQHWRLCLPRPFGTPSSLGGWSKFLEPIRSLLPLLGAVGTALSVAVAGTVLVFERDRESATPRPAPGILDLGVDWVHSPADPHLPSLPSCGLYPCR